MAKNGFGMVVFIDKRTKKNKKTIGVAKVCLESVDGEIICPIS